MIQFTVIYIFVKQPNIRKITGKLKTNLSLMRAIYS